MKGGISMEKESVLAMHLVLWVMIGVAFVVALWWIFNGAKKIDELERKNRDLKDKLDFLQEAVQKLAGTEESGDNLLEVLKEKAKKSFMTFSPLLYLNLALFVVFWYYIPHIALCAFL